MIEEKSVTKKPHKGKKKLPDTRKRVLLSARVAPQTKAFLEGLGSGNLGRAMDALCDAIADRRIANLLDNGNSVKVVHIGG
jgi:hypothetical protein